MFSDLADLRQFSTRSCAGLAKATRNKGVLETLILLVLFLVHGFACYDRSTANGHGNRVFEGDHDTVEFSAIFVLALQKLRSIKNKREELKKTNRRKSRSKLPAEPKN